LSHRVSDIVIELHGASKSSIRMGFPSGSRSTERAAARVWTQASVSKL
jgi:hypothetical protein